MCTGRAGQDTTKRSMSPESVTVSAARETAKWRLASPASGTDQSPERKRVGPKTDGLFTKPACSQSPRLFTRIPPVHKDPALTLGTLIGPPIVSRIHVPLGRQHAGFARLARPRALSVGSRGPKPATQVCRTTVEPTWRLRLRPRRIPAPPGRSEVCRRTTPRFERGSAR